MIKNNYFYFISFCLFILSGFCCNKVADTNNENISKIKIMQFNVDEKYINEQIKIEEINIYFSAPKNLILMDTVSFNKIQSDLEKKVNILPNTYKLNLLNIFYDEKISFFCIISKIMTENFDEIKKIFNENNKLKSDEFIYNDFKVFQILYTNENILNFKLLFNDTKNLFEIDYIIPKQNYNEEIARRIESSIGSIKK